MLVGGVVVVVVVVDVVAEGEVGGRGVPPSALQTVLAKLIAMSSRYS